MEWNKHLLRAYYVGFRGALLLAALRRGRTGQGSFGPGSGARAAAPPPAVSELDRADAWLLWKAHETAFLSWFRNGLLASGIGVISFMQSDMGREAAYGFFLLGGLCVFYGGASYVAGLASLRRPMMLSLGGALVGGAAVASTGLLWACAVGLYLGQLELEVEGPEPEPGLEPEDADEEEPPPARAGPPRGQAK